MKTPFHFLYHVTPFLIVVALQLPVRSAAGQDDWQSAMQTINPEIGATFPIDETRVQAAGIRKISGQHLDLYTDVRETAGIDDLAEVFDRCLAPWCDYFEIEIARTKGWKMRAYLIADANQTERFRQAGLLPVDLPDFYAGFQRNQDLWLYFQPGDYYTRHLLIHEGTHGFMQWFLSGYGAPWYGEGMAELFGVHRWHDQQLQLRYRLRDRSEAPYWGRVKRIHDDRREGQSMTLSDVLNTPPTAFREVRYYAWSWAACDFFSTHEKTAETFAALKRIAHLDSTRFNQRFMKAIQADWKDLENDWELYVGEIEYGYQAQRGRLHVAKPLTKADASPKFEIRTDQSWQATTLNLKQGDRVRISGSGEFTIGSYRSNFPYAPTDGLFDPTSPAADQLWPCQSNGITIAFFRDHPLGMLQAGILDGSAADAASRVAGLLQPTPIGKSSEFTASRDGLLCLRINESPAKMDDNQGVLEVVVEKLK